MQIHLKDLAVKGESVRISEKVDFSAAVCGAQDVISCEPAQVELTAAYRDGAVVVQGEATLTVTQSCSRCLTPVKQTLLVPIRELFKQTPDKNDLDAADEDDDVHLVAEDKIDLMPYVEENVLVALPFAPLCSDACKGLCPNCGENRNERDCGCNTDRVDPRLAGLADFFK